MWTSHMQAIVLAAGRGSRMTELLGNQIPKCLIPIGGNPLIFYPLKALAELGFKGKDVLVIIQEKVDVRKAIDAAAEKAGLKVEKLCVPEDSEDFGTAESIRIALQAKKIIQRDVLIISCDLIGELPLSQLVKMHGLKGSSCTALFLKGLPIPTATTLPGPKNKSKIERDILGVKFDSSEMVMLAAEADLDDDLPIPVSILKHHPSFKIVTNLTDAHCYIVKKKVLEKLLDPDVDEDSKHISLKGEFIPYLIQEQFEDHMIKELGKTSFYCLVDPDKTCIRINSIRNYALINQSADWLKSIFGNHVSRSRETKIGKGCKLVASILGDHTNVGEKVKLTNVIGMDHVTIEPGSEIQNTIISSNASIGENSFVKDCLVGPKYHVAPGARHVNEHLTVVEEALFEA